jgi:hypothetical protein
VVAAAAAVVGGLPAEGVDDHAELPFSDGGVEDAGGFGERDLYIIHGFMLFRRLPIGRSRHSR